MTPALLLRLTVNPTLSWLEEMGVRSDDRARVMLLAIALQESGCRARRQVPVAHAMGFWQFERAGGVAGVLQHAASRPFALDVCEQLAVAATPEAVHPALEHNDVLACAFARLLLWTDPAALPGPDQISESWLYYRRNWRPGKPRPGEWPENWQAACQTVGTTYGPALVS
ncbi:hypothetical protein [Roseomonas chloroacetimidivorans]|uniref:hypothetical protein n=1 Tax=Roseomonas chloroacetimidivorans TaxID=1766656 RepID=UPI003C71CB99